MVLLRTSIRNKLLLVLGLLLLSALGLYTLMASSIFREEKTALLYEINHAIAVSMAAQLRSSLIGVAEQVKPYLLTQVASSNQKFRLDEKALKRAHVKALYIFRKQGELYHEVQFNKNKRSEPPWLYDHLKLLKDAEAHGYALYKFRPPKSDLLHLVLATPIEIQFKKEKKLYFAIAELEGKFFLEPLQMANIFNSYLVTAEGAVITHLEDSRITPAPFHLEHPLLDKISAAKDRLTTGVHSYAFDGKKWYGAYAPVGISNLYLISQADAGNVEQAVMALVTRSIWFAFIALGIMFLASIPFSQGLTKNLRELSKSARRMGRGNLDTQITLHTGDEVEELAKSFEWMRHELRSSYEAIKKHNLELEDKVRERTRELWKKNVLLKEAQEAQLKTAQLAAAGEIAGRTAHEILNPLTGIITRAKKFAKNIGSKNDYSRQLLSILGAWDKELKKGGTNALVKALEEPSKVDPKITLFEEDLDNLKKIVDMWQKQLAPLSKSFEFIHDRGQHINTIVNKMRKLIRSSSEKSQINCRDAISNAISTMSDHAESLNIFLETEYKATHHTTLVNKDEFIQILTNMIRNSLQAISTKRKDNPELPGKILISTSNEDKTIHIDILDNGIGIPKEQQGQVFGENFTTKSAEEGTGLGLAICRRYARAFGGEAKLLFSEPRGKGTCFRVTLPVLPVQDVQDIPEAA